MLVKHIKFCYYYKTLFVTTALKIRYYCIVKTIYHCINFATLYAAVVMK